jgi:dTDP-4-dehydrorhamnose 3,5-epimerase
VACEFVQTSVSHNAVARTLRGLHFQAPPHEEDKLVTCVRGSLFDVLLDLRRDSPTFRSWFGVELSAGNGRSVFVPAGLAHGFQTLEDETTVLYNISAYYRPEAARGVRWDDPAFGIEWPPAETRVISERDRSFPDFRK